jgi:hypothetical protein
VGEGGTSAGGAIEVMSKMLARSGCWALKSSEGGQAYYSYPNNGESYALTRSAVALRRTPRAQCGTARLGVRAFAFSVSFSVFLFLSISLFLFSVSFSYKI